MNITNIMSICSIFIALLSLYNMGLDIDDFLIGSILWLSLMQLFDSEMQDPNGNIMCDCKMKGKSNKLKWYYDNRGNRIGNYCFGCGVESLIGEYIKGITDRTTGVLYPRKPQVPEQQNKTFKVDPRHLKPGDHIIMRRWFLYWHHAIVWEINAEKKRIKVIHWTINKKGNIKIESGHLEVTNGSLYRINYPDSVTKENPTELVLARARSRVGDVGYNLLLDNCESFATFCKCGIEHSHQSEWLTSKILEIICCNIVVCIIFTFMGIIQYSVSEDNNTLPCPITELPWETKRIYPVEVIEPVITISNCVAAGIVIGMEVAFTALTLRKARKEKRNGKITENGFREVFIQRTFEGLLCAGVELISCHIVTSFEPFEIIIRGITWVLIGGVVSKVLGTAFGNVLGMIIISKLLTENDTTVRGIDILSTKGTIVSCSRNISPAHYHCQYNMSVHNNRV